MIAFAPQIAPDNTSLTVLRRFDGAPDEDSIYRADMKSSDAIHLPRVALLIESSRTYGRGILAGIAHYAHLNGPWSLFTQERELHSGVPDWLLSWKGDGIIARIEDKSMANVLLRLGHPVVDVLGNARFRGIPSFDTDAKAVARLAADF